MPETPRIESASNNYHVVLCGNNKQRIFEDTEDYEKFMSVLFKYKKICGFVLYAWCLMPNHIHILLKVKNEPLSMIFQRINTSFVMWYNRKYERVGHLYKGRYYSEPVEDESYFLTVMRYIHMNPVKGGLCKKPEDYRNSSYAYYFLSDYVKDSDMILSLIRKDEFRQYHLEKNEDICLDVEKLVSVKLTDDEACEIIRKETGLERISLIETLPYQQRNQAIRILLDAGGSLRQINRLTGVSIRLIRDIKDKSK